jgi:histidinol dehydrogenase
MNAPDRPAASRLIRRLDAGDPQFDMQLKALLSWEADHDAAIEQTVSHILEQIRTRGDAALIEFTQRFDRLAVSGASALELPASALSEALVRLPADRREALQAAADRVRAYHERQRAPSWEYTDTLGNRLGQKITPLDRVGLYVPGGKAAYPSSVLMNAIPAKVAGVAELIMVCPTPDGVRNDMVLAAAAIAGVDRVFTIGGAQAVGALAWGTATVPAVDKIVGPGNAYVAEAKRRVFGRVGIDMIAGPSEILILCDGHTDPDWIAMDLFSQAEHDELAQSILLCPDAAFLDAVEASVARLLPDMPRREVIAASLSGRGALIQVASLEQACQIVDQIAPEHLEISTQDPRRWAERIRHAGAMFLGPWSSESLGDYCAGPNHVLPTMRTARFSSPLGVYDFQKRSSLIEVSEAGAARLGDIASVLAHGEGLQAHARSAELRLPAARSSQGVPRAEPADWVRPEVLAMSAYAVPDARGLVKLDAMENPFRLPEALQGALGERLAAVAINRYPAPSYARLKQLVRERLEVPAGAEVLLGNGSDELITIMSMALARPGATVVAPVPSFVMYEVTSRLTGLRHVPVPLTADFDLDLPAMLRAIEAHRPALVWLAYPNNPTGQAFDRAHIEAILDAAPGLVVVDEAYRPFADDTFMTDLPRRPHLVVMRTVSKLGLAGVRLGYMAAAPAWIAEFDKVRPPYNLSVLNEAAAEFALEHFDVLLEQTAGLRTERERLQACLRDLPGVTAFPSQANFILVRVPDAARVAAGMRQRGVLIKDVSRTSPLLAHCLRISVGTPQDNARMLEALQGALADLDGRPEPRS